MQKIWDTVVTGFDRYITAFMGSTLIAFFMPTKGYMFALIIMFGFNIWCGMRSDGISIINCKKFSFRKIFFAFCELFMYLMITQSIYSFMTVQGDQNEALIVVKTLTYVISYFAYLQNGFKNLVIAYPKNKTLRIIYHLIRFEFKKALPSHIQESIDSIEEKVDYEMKGE